MSVNIFQSLYDLLNTYIFGGSVEVNTYADLVLTLISTIGVLFAVSIPFLVVFSAIKFISRCWD